MESQGNQEFADLKVSPSELSGVQFFRYRQQGTRKLVEYIRFNTRDNKDVYLFDTVSKNQFVTRIGGKISELRSVYDYNERNQLLQHLASGRSDPVILRLVRSNGHWHCYAVVTDKFTEVGHAELYRMVEAELVKRDLGQFATDEFRTSTRVWKTYLFHRQVGQKVGDLIQVGLRVCNSVKGTSSIIFYPFWMRLACTNGMTSSRGIWKPATVHTGDKSAILSSVKQTLEESLNEAFGLEKLVEESMSITISETDRDRVIRILAYRKSFAKYVKRDLIYQVRHEQNNLWGIVNALTYVATHKVEATDSRLKIEQTAHSLLRSGSQGLQALLSDKEAVL